MKTVELDYVPLDSAEARDRVAHGLPFVSRVDWPAIRKWSAEYIGERAIPKRITVWEKTPEGRTEVEISIRDYLNIVFDAGQERYELPSAPQTRLWFDGKADPNFAPLLEDIVFPPLFERSRLFGMTLFPGAAGWDNGMHYDGIGMVNLNVQIFGRKRWRIFHPRDASVFEPSTALDTTMVPPFLPGITKHPLACADQPGFEDVVCHDADLGPGDAIFVPAYWMHWVVYGAEPALGCNFWWHSPEITQSGPSAAQVLINALLIVYRERMPGATLPEIAATLNQLPIETRELLRDIERTMISDRRLIESPTLFLGLRKDAGHKYSAGQIVAGHGDRAE